MQVRREVFDKSKGAQTPGEYNQLFAPVYLAGASSGGGQAPAPTMAATPAPQPAVTMTVTAPKKTYGSLAVTAASAGTLYLDGAKLGELPAGATANLGNIETGSRKLELRYAEGAPESRTVTVTEGQSTSVSFSWKKAAAAAPAAPPPPAQSATGPTPTLARSYGSLGILAASAGRLYLDGALMGDVTAGTEARLQNVQAGSRCIELRYADGEKETRTFPILEDQETTICFNRRNEAIKAPAGIRDQGLGAIAKELVGKADFDVGMQYAVIIGIDRYKEWPSLRNAVSEARALRKVLIERYYIDAVFELYDAQASIANINRIFTETLPGAIRQQDSLFVFFSGRGQLDVTGNTGSWMASDGTNETPRNGGITKNRLADMASGLKAKRICIISDFSPSFSGDFIEAIPDAAPVTISSYKAYYSKALQLTARQSLSSGSFELDGGDFGRLLVDELRRSSYPLLDPMTLFANIRSRAKTTPLFSSLPGHEPGASFVLFLKTEAAP